MSEAAIEALESQVGCYRRLAKLAELQHMHVQQDQIESLLGLLERRRDVLEEISRLELAIAPIKKDWGGFVATASAEIRARAEELLAQSRQLLEQITTSDRHDALVLQQRKLNLGKEINQTASASRINRTYAAAAYGTRESRMNLRR